MNVPYFHEEKTTEEQVKLDKTLSEIERLKNENKYLKKGVQICDERDYK